MTDINVDELIVELHTQAAETRVAMEGHSPLADLHDRAAGRLAQLQRSADEWWKQYDAECERAEKAERERDEALAVIERAKAVLQHGSAGDPTAKDQALRILSTVPDDALRAVKAEAWDEGLAAGLREANQHQRGIHQNNPALNPYREEATRG